MNLDENFELIKKVFGLATEFRSFDFLNKKLFFVPEIQVQDLYQKSLVFFCNWSSYMKLRTMYFPLNSIGYHPGG